MSIGPLPDCLTCKHLKGHRTCAAFLEVPEPVWWGLQSHKQPIAGDNGIQYEPKGNEESGADSP
jgi:hypothetical protein